MKKKCYLCEWENTCGYSLWKESNIKLFGEKPTKKEREKQECPLGLKSNKKPFFEPKLINN